MGLRLVASGSLIVLSILSGCVTGSGAHGLFGEIRVPNYQPEEHLSWVVSVPPGFALRLQLQHHETAASSACKHNYVEVFTDRKHLGRMCGNVTSSRFHYPSLRLDPSGQNTVKLRVRCHSVNQEGRRGFSVFYEAVDIDECGLHWEGEAPCHHFCHNYIGGYRCYCRQGYSLHSDGNTCKVAQCGVPEDLENGSYVYVGSANGSRVDTVISYRCRQHYYTMASGADGMYTCRANGKWMNSKVGETLPRCEPVCGKPRDPPLLIQRIFGGSRARDGNFPWHVYFESTACGGALVSDSWVLTSASCTTNVQGLRMFAGGADRRVAEHWQLLEAAEIHLHPNFTLSTLNNDIALVKLREKLHMGPTLSPICLPGRQRRYKVEVGMVGYISGFGRTERFSQSEVLMFAPVPVVEVEKCRNITDNMICAGSSGVDACAGDGGGSLVFRDPLRPDTYYSAGIVSWGYRCGNYGVYTNVRKYLGWIESIMQA